VRTIAKEAALPLVWHAHLTTLGDIREHNTGDATLHNVQHQPFNNWDYFLILSKQVPPNYLFFIVSSQPGHISYVRQLTRLPYY